MNRTRNNACALTRWLLAAMLFVCASAAVAERADREQPINIESDRMSADDAKRTAVFEGRVVLTQGTLVIRADRIEVRQDRDGFQFAVANGNPVTFRQKREGTNEYVEGEAERAEYDGKAEQLQLFNRARLKREGGDDVSGNYIAYNARTQEFSVRSSKEADQRGRVRAVIMPRSKDGGGASGQTPAAPAPKASSAK